MIMEARVDMARGEKKIISEPCLNWGGGGGGGGGINENGQVVNNKIFLGMLGTIPNRVTGNYGYSSLFTRVSSA